MKFLLLLLICSYSLFASIGKVYAIKGKGSFLRSSGTIPITLGATIENEDLIRTSKNTQIQIIFSDRTIITLGDLTEFKIGNYLYDTKENSQVNFTLKKGNLKSITGAIGKLAPERFKVNTKTASIGVKGTTFVLKVAKNTTTLATLSGETTFTNHATNRQHVVKENKQLFLSHKNKKIRVIALVEKDIHLSQKATKGRLKKDASNSLALATQKDEGSSTAGEITDTAFNQDNIESLVTTTLNRKRVTVNHDQHFSYGYWNSGSIAATPFAEGSELSSTVVGVYRAVANYSGNVVSIRNGVASTIGNMWLDVDFLNNGIPSGGFNITDAQGDTWGVNLAGGTLSGNGFKLSGTDITHSAGTITYSSGSIDGNFFGGGTNDPITFQDGVAGTFNLKGNGDTVSIEGSYGAINTGITPQ